MVIYHLGFTRASMGPQLDSCGRLASRAGAGAAVKPLQWGRNLTVAEGTAFVLFWGRRLPLQWGRNLTVAEGNATSI